MPQAAAGRIQRLERLEAKRAETARLKAEKLSESLLELGGPIVQLPAVVLRDQTIIPVTPHRRSRGPRARPCPRSPILKHLRISS